MIRRVLILSIALLALSADMVAQDQSSNSGVRRREANSDRNSQSSKSISDRAQSHYTSNSSLTDADVQWMKVIYRQLDLNDDRNAALYFPEEPIEGQENLFRIMMRLLCDNEIHAYEYLDGRELFTDKYQVNMSDVFDRFYIPYTTAKGSSDKNPKYVVDENDVPTNEVLSYYIIERWEFDTRANRMRTYVDAICPILHRVGDFGGDAVKYPMFWIKYNDIRPWLANQQIFVSDDNNMPTCNYDDFFNLNMYAGDIYKTRNLKNRTLMQLYPDPDDLKRAQDSIQAYLDSFEKKLWVPDREDVVADKGGKKKDKKGGNVKDSDAAPDLESVVKAPAADTNEAEVETPAVEEKKSTRSTARSNKSAKKSSNKKPKTTKPKSTSSSATKSVRKRK